MIRYYYFLTPLFVVLDALAGWNMRIAGLSDPTHRTLYYGFLAVCAVLVWRLPRLTAPVAIVESSINFFLLIASVMFPILGLGYLFQDATIGFTGWPHLLNFVVTGLVLSWVFRTNMAQLGNPGTMPTSKPSTKPWNNR